MRIFLVTIIKLMILKLLSCKMNDDIEIGVCKDEHQVSAILYILW